MKFSATTLVAAATVLFLACSAAHADLLNLQRLHYPLAYSGNVGVTYDADGGSTGEGLLAASGTPFVTLQLTEADTGTTYMGSFSLQLEVYSGAPDDGEIVVGGNQYLQVTYKPTGPLGPDEVIFYSTQAQAFGYGPEDKFEFIFTQQGDTAFIPDGKQIGVILTANSIPDFNEPDGPVFTDDFANMNNGESNTFYLPEPSAGALLALGALAMLHRRRRRGA